MPSTSERARPRADGYGLVGFRRPSDAGPLQGLLPLLADPQGFTSVVHNATTTGSAKLVASTMLSIWGNIDDLDHREADAAESAFTTMLAAGIGGGDALRDTGRETVDAALRAAVNRYLAANLRTADLSAPRVARRFGISLRKLHGLYEVTDCSFAQTIMALRVEGCGRELAAAGNERSMSDMASRWGFSDLSHLNRVSEAIGAVCRRSTASHDSRQRPPPRVPNHRGPACSCARCAGRRT